MGHKKPKAAFNPNTAKTPRIETQENYDSKTPTWSFRVIDIGGPWCFTLMNMDDLHQILEKIRGFETMKWSEIKGKRHHPIPIEDLSPAAKKRLEDIKQDDVGSIFSFAITGEKRFHGIRDGAVCRLLWYDPQHKVCPSNLKYT